MTLRLRSNDLIFLSNCYRETRHISIVSQIIAASFSNFVTM